MNPRLYLYWLLVVFHSVLLFGAAWILGMCLSGADWFGLLVCFAACAINVSALYRVLVELDE